MINALKGRLAAISSELDDCRVFADVGCDHGYIAGYMLENGKCDLAIVSDVSAACLEKADRFLRGKFAGKYCAIVSDGFERLPYADQALIAGMGGELIVSILERAPYLPEKLVLQPMKNSDKVRRFLIGNGYAIKRDYTFSDGKYYDLIKAEKGADHYTEDEYEYGRDNLAEKGEAFREKYGKLLKTLQRTLTAAKGRERESLEIRIARLEELLK